MPSTGRTWILAFLVALVVYGATADYGPQWQDSGWQQWRIVTGEISHPAGLVVTHPLQYWLGRLALHLPRPEPAGRTTVVSVLAGAIAIANLAAFGWLVTRRLSAALIPAAAMMLSHTFWQHSTHTESYALVGALLTAEWLCIGQLLCAGGGAGWLVAAAAANGLGIANHLLAGLGTPVLVVFLWWWVWGRGSAGANGAGSRRTADAGVGRYSAGVGGYVVLAAIVWVVCTLPYSGLVVATAMQAGDWCQTLHSAVFGDFEPRVLNTQVSGRMLLLTAGFLIYNLPGLTVPLALHALVRRTATPAMLVRVLAAYLAIHAVFAVRYAITDQYTFLFPIYLCLSGLAAIGLADVQSLWATRGTSGWRFARLVTMVAGVTALWPPVVYEIAYRVLSARNSLSGMITAKPYRDGYAAMLLPWGDRSGYVQRTNAEAFKLAGTGGVIVIGDEMLEHALRYHRHVTPEAEAVEFVFLNEVKAREAWPDLRENLRSWLAAGRAVVLAPRERDKAVIGPLNADWARRGDLYLLENLRDK
jgi:hypothetical protein